jgi:hypothetical protein
MITNIPDRERALQAEVDELREGVKRYKEMADMASAEIAALTAELARLRAQVPVGWIGPSGFTHNTATNRMWMRESPKLAAKLSPVYAAPPAQPAEPVDGFGGNLDEAFDAPAEPDQELPGMWEPAALSGGATDCLPAEPVTKTAPPPVRCPVCNGNDASMSCPRPDAGVPGCLRDARRSL